jgi:hypothetical protein
MAAITAGMAAANAGTVAMNGGTTATISGVTQAFSGKAATNPGAIAIGTGMAWRGSALGWKISSAPIVSFLRQMIGSLEIAEERKDGNAEERPEALGARASPLAYEAKNRHEAAGVRV